MHRSLWVIEDIALLPVLLTYFLAQLVNKFVFFAAFCKKTGVAILQGHFIEPYSQISLSQALNVAILFGHEFQQSYVQMIMAFFSMMADHLGSFHLPVGLRFVEPRLRKCLLPGDNLSAMAKISDNFRLLSCEIRLAQLTFFSGLMSEGRLFFFGVISARISRCIDS